MKTTTLFSLTALCFSALGHGRPLLEAISFFPQLSNFTALLTDNPDLAGALLTTKSSSLTTAVTVLVPDNSAFDKVAAIYQVPMREIGIQQLEPFLLYHVLAAKVTSDVFSAPQGLTVPSLLTDEQFNNRSGGEQLGSHGTSGNDINGQVVFMQQVQNHGGSPRRLTLRQTGELTVSAQGGLGRQINLTAVDGVWDGGYFQIVDKFLDLPLNCTTTIRRWNASSLSYSLERTGLGPILDTTPNVTCFAPNDQAFQDAGSPSTTADVSVLDHALKYHTITQPLYTSFLQDGQMYETVSGEQVRISIRDGQIYVNDAKIVKQNVITNNGVMHVIDRVMTPLNESNSSTSTTASASGTASATGTGASSTSSANIGSLPTSQAGFGVWILTLISMLGGGLFI